MSRKIRDRVAVPSQRGASRPLTSTDDALTLGTSSWKELDVRRSPELLEELAALLADQVLGAARRPGPLTDGFSEELPWPYAPGRGGGAKAVAGDASQDDPYRGAPDSTPAPKPDTNPFDTNPFGADHPCRPATTSSPDPTPDPTP